MRKKEVKFAVIALSSFGEYRRNFVKQVADEFGSRVIFYSGKQPISKGVKILQEKDTSINYCGQLTLLSNFYILQFPLRQIFFAQIVVLDLNPRILSNWSIILMRRTFGRTTYLWGHAWPIKGKASKGEKIRNIMRGLASGIFTYTLGEADRLRVVHPKKNISCVPNSLYLKSELGFETTTNRFRILYVGRLIQEKKPQFLLEAFINNFSLFPGCVLTIVGDGSLMEEMKLKATASNAAKWIEFYGHVSDFETLKGLYSESIFSVSPGYVGLSLTQSLGFGVPMLISESENHSPEIELASDGENAIFFKTDSIVSLIESMRKILKDREFWQSQGFFIVSKCADSYSIDKMVEGMSSVVRGFINED